MISAETVCIFCVRHQLLNKKNKVDKLAPRKPMINASREKVATLLSSCFHTEDYKDETRPLCNSMLSGSINSSKTRILNFVMANRAYQGLCSTKYSHTSVKVRNLSLVSLNSTSTGHTKPFRIIFKDKPDGTVGMQYGDPEDFDNQNSHECTLILPTKVLCMNYRLNPVVENQVSKT
jgi:hypothetical protein